MSYVLKSHRILSQGWYGCSYFTGPGFAGDQRLAVRFGKKSWAESMARTLRRFGVRVVRIRRARKVAR